MSFSRIKIGIYIYSIIVAIVAFLTPTALLAANSDSLSGQYLGMFAYYDNRGISKNDSFYMTLIVEGNNIQGHSSEIAIIDGRERIATARIKGQIVGDRLIYTKTYDGSAGRSHSVNYNVKRSLKGGLYQGRWKIGLNVAGPVVFIKFPDNETKDVLIEMLKMTMLK